MNLIQNVSRRLAVLLAILAILAPVGAAANAPFTFGFGARAIAMGGAYAGLADDISGPYYNPAGMTQRKVVQIGGGYQYIKPWMEVNGSSFDVKDNHSNSMGVSLPLPLGGWLRNRIFIGMAFFMPWDLVLGLKVPLPGDAQFLLLQNEPRVTTIMPALAVELHPAISIGASINLYDDTFGSFNATLTSENTPVLEVNQELIATFNPAVSVHMRPGALWPALEGLGVGLVWRDKFCTEYRFSPDIFIGTVPLLIDLAAISLYNPRQYVLGLAYRRGLVIGSLDIAYNRWSKIPDPNLEAKFDFRIPLIPVTFSESAYRNPDFRDTVTPRAGLEYKCYSNESLDFLARAGYYFDPSPVPEQTGETNYMDNDKHVFSFGAGAVLRKVPFIELSYPVSIDFFIQYHYMTERSHTKEAWVGSVPPPNPGYPEISAGGHVLAVGLFFSSAYRLFDDRDGETGR